MNVPLLAGRDLTKWDLKAQLRDLDRADYEESLYAFLEAAWPYMDPAPWMDGWCIEAIAEHLEAVADGEITRLIINIPPRTSKTSLCSIAFPAWVWAQSAIGPTSGPQVRFMYASYGETLSLDHSVYCRRLIKTDWYQELWGDRFKLMGDLDTKHAFGNDKGGERRITSIDARVTGRGGQVIIIDDPNAANEALSEAKVQATNDWWDQTMSNRLNDRRTGAIVLIQQRLAENDLTGHILEKYAGGWQHLMLPMRYEADRSFVTSIGWKDPRTEEGELLWPERFDEQGVRDLERDMGPWGSSGQLQQRPEPKGGGVIRSEWWKVWEEAAFPPMDFIMASLDTAYTEKTENDYSALTVWGVWTLDTVAHPSRIIDRDGRPQYLGPRVVTEPAPRVMLMNAWRERLPLHELVVKTAETCKKLKVDMLLIENKAAGISTSQEIRRLYGDEPWSVRLYDPKSTDKLARLYSVQHLFAEGMVYVPGTPDESYPSIVNLRAWAEMVIQEVSQFPKGRHDDLVDTVSSALRHMRDMGLLVRAPERLSAIEDAKQYVKPLEPLYPG